MSTTLTSPPELRPRASAMLPRRYRVASTRAESPDSVTLQLVPVDEPLPAPEPGQFNMLYAFGVGEVPISTSGSPGEDGRLTHTIRSVGPVSSALCRLQPGEVAGVRGPFGTTWPLSEAEGHDVVIIAGGVGLAPVRPAIESLIRHRRRYRRIGIILGARRPEHLLFADDIRTWAGRADIQLLTTVDAASESWEGNVGIVTSLVPRLQFDPAWTLGIVCGPEIMMRFAAEELRNREVAEEKIWLSMERSMKCALGHCGQCQYGPDFVCRDGAVFRYMRVRERLHIPEI